MEQFIYWRKRPGVRRGSCPKQDSIWPLPTIPPSKRNHRPPYIYIYTHTEPPSGRRAQARSPASAINLISNALSARPPPASLFPKNHTRPLQPLTTSRNFQFFRVPRDCLLSAMWRPATSTFRSIEPGRGNFTSTWTTQDAKLGGTWRSQCRNRKSGVAHVAGIRGGWNRTRDPTLFFLLLVERISQIFWFFED